MIFSLRVRRVTTAPFGPEYNESIFICIHIMFFYIPSLYHTSPYSAASPLTQISNPKKTPQLINNNNNNNAIPNSPPRPYILHDRSNGRININMHHPHHPPANVLLTMAHHPNDPPALERQAKRPHQLRGSVQLPSRRHSRIPDSQWQYENQDRPRHRHAVWW